MTDLLVRARNPRLGCLMVITAAVLFGFNGGISRVAIGADIPVETFTTLRITSAAVVFALAAAVLRPSVLRPPRGRSLLLIVALGLVGVAGLQLTYNIAITRLPLGIALLLEYLAPVLIVLWVRFVRRERVHPRMWVAVALALGGLAVVGQVWNGITLDALGVAMGLAAAVCFATYFLLGEHQTDSQDGGRPASNRSGERPTSTRSGERPTSTDPLHVIVWAFLVATLVMNVAQPVWTTPSLSGTTSLLGRLDGFSVAPWVAVSVVVVLGTVAPFFLMLLALRHLPATVVTVIAMLEPVVATVLGWAWFSESLTTVQVAGVLAVLAGIVIAQTARTVEPALLPPP